MGKKSRSKRAEVKAQEEQDKDALRKAVAKIMKK